MKINPLFKKKVACYISMSKVNMKNATPQLNILSMNKLCSVYAIISPLRLVKNF